MRIRRTSTSSAKEAIVTTPFKKLSFNTAKKHIKDPYMKEVVEERHFTVGWQNARNIKSFVRRKCWALVGTYQPSLQAVPLAIGKVVIQRSMHIIEDHDCIHIDVKIQMIVFSFNLGMYTSSVPLKCKAIMVHDDCILGQLYGMINVVNKPGVPNLKPGDEFTVKMTGIQFKNELVQILSTTSRNRLQNFY